MKKLLILLSIALMLFVAGCTGDGGPVKMGTLMGQVINSVDESPVPDVCVKVFGEWQYTDEMGMFYYDCLPAANHTLIVDDLGWEYHKEVVAVPAYQDTYVTVAVTPVHEVSLTGTVYNVENQVIAGAEIFVQRLGEHYWEGVFYTGENGTFLMLLYPGSYRFAISYWDEETYDYCNNTFEFEVTGGMIHDFYLWGGFDCTEGANPIFSWQGINIGVPVVYHIELYKTINYFDNENYFFTASYDTTDTSVQLGTLVAGGSYVAKSVAINADTNELISENDFYFIVDVPEPTLLQQVECYVSSFEYLYNWCGPYCMDELISESYMDDLGRDKKAFIHHMMENWSSTMLFHDINVTVLVDEYGILVGAHVELIVQTIVWDDYTRYEVQTPAAADLVVEDDIIKLIKVY